MVAPWKGRMIRYGFTKFAINSWINKKTRVPNNFCKKQISYWTRRSLNSVMKSHGNGLLKVIRGDVRSTTLLVCSRADFPLQQGRHPLIRSCRS